jgi:hypothetical protein
MGRAAMSGDKTPSALAVGALAIGFLAIGRLSVGRAHARGVCIDRLSIGTLDVERFKKGPKAKRK